MGVTSADLDLRARRHAAHGEPARLAIIDALAVSDRAPTELSDRVDLPSNLLAHHLDVLEDVGFVTRHRSSGDGRRRYVHLHRDALLGLVPGHRVPSSPALFVCTANSARSQLAAALWSHLVGADGSSAGTHPADRVHPGAVAAAARAGLDLRDAAPAVLVPNEATTPLVVTVCDQAHEALGDREGWLHWSVPDPVAVGTAAAFDRTVEVLRDRIVQLAGAPGARS